MRFSCREAVEYDLHNHYLLLDKYEKACCELSQYKDCHIKQSKVKNGKVFYAIKTADQSKYKYLGDDSHPAISGIRDYNFYKTSLKMIKTNINALEGFLRVYRKTNADSVNDLLPPSLKLPPQDALLRLEPEVDKWLKDNLAIKKKHPVFDPAGLKVKAFDGTMMRSRAECIHHEAFYIYNVPSIFELPYRINGDVLHPDFTVLDVFTMERKIMEHLGNWFHSNVSKRNKYRSDSIIRWDQYSEIGFFPETNLLLTFGADENSFDSQAIHRKIAMLASPPPSTETIELLQRR